MECRMNESEKLFHSFCKSRGWRVQCIDPHSMPDGSNAPDFYLQPFNRDGIVVEVKQFDANPQERDEARRISGGEVVVRGTTPGKRLRGVISHANKQIKAFKGAVPGMLVVHNRTGIGMHDRPYAVLTAMRGLDVIDVYVPANPGSPPVFGPERPGPGKKLTAEMNTSVSCVAVLREFWPESEETTREAEHALDVYHNRFAKHPLDPTTLVGNHVTHYRMNAEQTSWEIHPRQSCRDGLGA